MASLLDALGAAANPLTAAVTGNQQGIAAGNEINAGNMMDVVKLYQQKAAADLARQRGEAEIAHLGAQTDEARARTTALGQPKPAEFEVITDPVSGKTYRVDKNAGRASAVTLDDPQGTQAPAGGPTLPNPLVLGRKPTNPVVGSPDWKDAEKYKASLTPKVDNTLVQVADPNDPHKSVYVHRSEAAGMSAPDKAGGLGGGGSLDADSRQKMMEQAKIDNAEMKRIEKRVQAGDLNFGTAAGLASAAANAHGGTGSEILSVLGNSAAGALDPDIQKYLTANSSYGRIMGNLQSKRYTDNQAQIEKTISGLKGNDLNNTIAYKQQLRDASLNDVAAPTGAGGRSQGSGGGTAQTATKAQQLWDAAVAKHGRDKVLSEYGPRP